MHNLLACTSARACSRAGASGADFAAKALPPWPDSIPSIPRSCPGRLQPAAATVISEASQHSTRGPHGPNLCNNPKESRSEDGAQRLRVQRRAGSWPPPAAARSAARAHVRLNSSTNAVGARKRQEARRSELSALQQENRALRLRHAAACIVTCCLHEILTHRARFPPGGGGGGGDCGGDDDDTFTCLSARLAVALAAGPQTSANLRQFQCLPPNAVDAPS